MASIPFATLEQADARSEAMWTAILGRPKRREDVTRYLYARRVRTGDEEADAGLPDGVDVAIEIPERDPYLGRLLREGRLTPAEVVTVATLYPTWQADTTYKVDDLCSHLGVLYKAITAHTSRLNSPPAISPTRWVVVG